MQYRQLGRSGTRVSELCLGTMNFGGRTDEQTSARIIDQALDAGINFIDTADVYGRGVSEEIVGRALAANGRRDDVVLATKAVANMGDGPNDHGASRYHLTRAVEASLRRLQTDRIDLFYLHIVDLTTPMDEILDTLDVLVRQGKILYVGTSKWPPTLIMEGLALADAHGLPRFVAEQPPYQMLDRGIENELVWMCMRQGIGICPWGPLAYGLLTGRYRKGQPFPEGGRMSNKDPDTDNRLTHAALDAVEEYLKLSEARGVPLAEFAHAWLLTRPGGRDLTGGEHARRRGAGAGAR
ncbi:MAG: aldo/keto reductase, partial [Armatimonadetes bacterium]|nr:aldo/keto reductase [Armatimonadota bacterium]